MGRALEVPSLPLFDFFLFVLKMSPDRLNCHLTVFMLPDRVYAAAVPTRFYTSASARVRRDVA